MVYFSSLIAASLAATLSVSAFPLSARQNEDFTLQNGLDAQTQNVNFAALSADSACDNGENACIHGAFAQCVDGHFVLTPCGGGLQCYALPLVNKPGTTVSCTTKEDAEALIANTGATGGITGDGNVDAQNAPAQAAQQPPAAPAAVLK